MEEIGLPRQETLSELSTKLARLTKVASSLTVARRETNTSPTEAQAEAGNYKKGRYSWQGLTIAIENPKGSTRSGVSEDGKVWSTKMKWDYGYFVRTDGKDGDEVDTFIGPDRDSELVHVINQVEPGTTKFDEHKVVIGATTEKQARKIYLDNYDRGWKGLGSIRAMTLPDFKKWLKDPKQTHKQAGDFVKMAKTYRLTGDVQQVGLRKTLHKLLDEAGIPGVAYNDARSRQVMATIGADRKRSKEVLEKIRQYLADNPEASGEFDYEEEKEEQPLYNYTFTPEDLAAAYGKQGMTILQARPTQEQVDWARKRFRLSQDGDQISGTLPQHAIDQLKGYEPIYPQQIDQPEEYGPMDFSRPKEAYDENAHVATVAVDLDGTLATHHKGNYDPKVIPPPRPGAKKWMDKIRATGARICMNTCRGDDKLTKEWLEKHDIPYDYINENPDQPDGTSDKILADVYWDDRAVSAKGRLADSAPEVIERLERV